MTVAPDYIVPTGDYIGEWMEDEGIKAAKLSRRLGVSRKHVSELLRGEATLSQELALALERVTGVPARIWNLHEAGYRSDLARARSADDLGSQYDRATDFPLSYLRKHGYITAPARDRPRTVQQLLAFLGVANLSAFDITWGAGSVAYRRRAVQRDHAPALAVWLRLAEYPPGRLRDLPAFDRQGLERLLPELRTLTMLDPDDGVWQATERLRLVGVALSVYPAIPGLGIHGVTRWLNGRPVIQLSCLVKTDDQVWFTLFHELGHVLLHGDKELYVSGDKNAEEEQANSFAADFLVPPEHVSRLPQRRDTIAVTTLAAEIGVAPSLVLGRIQHETGDYRWGHPQETHRLGHGALVSGHRDVLAVSWSG